MNKQKKETQVKEKEFVNVCLKNKCLFNPRNCTIVSLTCSKRAKIKQPEH